MKKKDQMTIQLEVEGMDEVTKKAERLVEILKEAKTLADELASIEFDINL